MFVRQCQYVKRVAGNIIIEKKFHEMGLPTTEENEEKEDDEIRFGSFEDLNEISVQEQQQSLPFRNDM